MSFWDQLFGKKGRIQAMPTMGPEQQGLMGSLIGGLGGPMGSGMETLQQMLSGSPEALQAYQQPMMRQFEEQTIPGIAERFTGMGAGAQRSSAFPQALGQAGAGLMENLAAQKSQLQMSAMQPLMQMLGLAQQPQFQYQQLPGTQGMMGPLAQGIGSGLGSMGSMWGLMKMLGLGGGAGVGAAGGML